MSSFAAFTLPLDSTKVRFKEPFVSEALNLKDAGIVPPGIYRGYTPSPQPNYVLNLNVDAVSGDSVAVVETTQHYNLTARSNLQIVLDMTGQVVFPIFVVLRTEYGITPTPLAGFTSSKVMVVQTTIDNGDPQKLHTGDVKLCKVLGFIGTVPNISQAIPTERQDNGGGLVTQTQLSTQESIITATKTDGSISVVDTAGAWVNVPGPGAAPTFDLTFTPGSTGLAEVIVSGCVSLQQANVGIGISVNGVDQVPAGLDDSVSNGFAIVGGGRGGDRPSQHQGVLGFTVFIPVIGGVSVTVRLRYICNAPAIIFATILATSGHPLTMSVRYRAAASIIPARNASRLIVTDALRRVA